MPTFPESKPVPWLKRKAHARRKRTPEEIKFYNSAQWRKTAKLYEQHSPLCEECLSKGKETDATGRKGVTDHIKRVKDGGAKYDFENLQRLCNHCHAVKSGKEAHLK
jgi:5-methylcytosine-specific restriction protein A